MSFEKNLNTYQFKTTNIKGKQYVEVNQRVIAFRTLSEFKGYGLTTEVLHLDADSCVIQATITDADRRVVAQGMAKRTSRLHASTKHLCRELWDISSWSCTWILRHRYWNLYRYSGWGWYGYQETRHPVYPKEKQQRNLCECCDVHQGGQEQARACDTPYPDPGEVRKYIDWLSEN